jgi:hypothetical protein
MNEGFTVFQNNLAFFKLLGFGIVGGKSCG